MRRSALRLVVPLFAAACGGAPAPAPVEPAVTDEASLEAIDDVVASEPAPAAPPAPVAVAAVESMRLEIEVCAVAGDPVAHADCFLIVEDGSDRLFRRIDASYEECAPTGSVDELEVEVAARLSRLPLGEDDSCYRSWDPTMTVRGPTAARACHTSERGAAIMAAYELLHDACGGR